MQSIQWKTCVLILVLFVCVRGFSELGKCCPAGKIFSGRARIDCVDVPNDATEIHSVDSPFRIESRKHGFPKCEELEDLTTTPLTELGPQDVLRMPACLEILHEETSKESVPIVVHCRSNKDRNETDKAPNAALPNLLSVKKCCPKDKVYDASTKTCIQLFESILDKDNHHTDGGHLMTLLPKNSGLPDYLMMTRGAPNCKGTINDYEIHADNITFDNGTFQVTLPAWHREVEEERILLTHENACLELLEKSVSKKERKLMVRICQSAELCNKKVCVRKCCSEDEFLSIQGGCSKSTTLDSPFDFHPAVLNFSNQNSLYSNYGVLVGIPCKFGMYPVLPSDGEWSITSSGLHTADEHIFQHHEYCMDIVRNSSDYEENLYPFVCFDDPMYEDEPSPTRYHFNTALQAISCMFLFLTLLVYICLPALQNLHGKTLMCHVASLILAFICLIIVPWVTPNSLYWQGTEADATVVCPLVGYIMLFAFLSAFSWLNIMCFDIWWTFGGLRGRSTRGRKQRKKFLFYCLYAWGFPVLLTMIALIIDHTQVLPLYLRPNINLMSCWFPKLPEFFGEMLFFIGPILIQLIMNIVFFVLTAIHCSKVKDEIKKMATDASHPKNKRFEADKTKLLMNVKLFIVMGVTWVAEIASFFVNKYAYNFKWREELFYVTDTFNCLQGLLIFILFVLKMRVYLALRKRLGWDKKKQGMSLATTALQDPNRIKLSASCSTLATTTFTVSCAP